MSSLCHNIFVSLCFIAFLSPIVIIVSNRDGFTTTMDTERPYICAGNICSVNLPTGKAMHRSVPSASSAKHHANHSLHANHSMLHPKYKHPSVEDLVAVCMEATHISSATQSPHLVEQAKKNARYMYDEYRKVIPERSLAGYKSHCWKRAFSAKWDQKKYSGRIGKYSLAEHDLDVLFTQNKYSVKYLNMTFPSRKYKSSLVCLPKLFAPGFQKCGTTYLYNFLQRLFSASTNQNVTHTTINAAMKEPRFWVRISPQKDVGVPKKSSLVGYLLNYTPGIKKVSEMGKKDTILMDGSHSMLFNWPRFRWAEDDLTNYCILPSVLPRLLPDAKFFVIMRNPASMLYSAFWYSCTFSKKLSAKAQLRGPKTFHYSVVFKIGLFNSCMRDSSVPAISQACNMKKEQNYSACILQRVHLLDKCTYALQVAKDHTSDDVAFHNCGRFSMHIALYYVHIRKWLSIVARERFHFLTLEDYLRNPAQVSQDILKFVDLETDIVDNKTLMEELGKSTPSNSQTAVNYKGNAALRMREDTKVMLERFYQPFNALLAGLLGWKLPW